MALFRKGSTKPKREKAFCPTCGAKNEAGVGRCRVCTSLMPQDHGESGIHVPGAQLQDLVEAEVEAPVETLAFDGAAGAPVSTLAEFEHFDPDALQIGEPSVPRPSSNDT